MVDFYFCGRIITSVSVSQDYPNLRTYCNHISIFADAKDQVQIFRRLSLAPLTDPIQMLNIQMLNIQMLPLDSILIADPVTLAVLLRIAFSLSHPCTYGDVVATSFFSQALWWAETMSCRPALGKTVFGLWAHPRKSLSGEQNEVIDKQPPRFMNTVSFFHYSSDAPVTHDDAGFCSSPSTANAWQTDGRRGGAEAEVEWLGKYFDTELSHILKQI